MPNLPEIEEFNELDDTDLGLSGYAKAYEKQQEHLTTLIAAFKRYGGHQSWCAKRWPDLDPDATCDCLFDQFTQPPDAPTTTRTQTTPDPPRNAPR